MTSQLRRAGRQMAGVFAFDLTAKLFLGLLAVLLIRWMAPTEYAEYTIGLAVSGLVVQLLATTFNRVYIIGFDRLALNGSEAPFLGLQLLIISVLLPVALLLRMLSVPMLLATAAVIAATCLSEFARTAFQREMRFWRFGQVELARAALSAGGVIALAWLAPAALRAPVVLVVQAAAAGLVSVIAVRRRVSLRAVLDLRSSFHIARGVLAGPYFVLFAYFGLLGLLSQMDVLVLNSLGTRGAVASFGAGFRFYSLLALALSSIHAVLLPTLQAAEELAERERIIASQWRVAGVLTPVVLAGAWASHWLIPLLDGGRYPDAVPVFQVLALMSVVSLAFSPHSNILLREHDFGFLTAAAAVSIATHWGLLHVLVPRHGALGAAYATALTFSVMNAAVYLRSRLRHARPLAESAGA
jgi:O-antigen/teichoic acid export membrane protein